MAQDLAFNLCRALFTALHDTPDDEFLTENKYLTIDVESMRQWYNSHLPTHLEVMAHENNVKVLRDKLVRDKVLHKVIPEIGYNETSTVEFLHDINRNTMQIIVRPPWAACEMCDDPVNQVLFTFDNSRGHDDEISVCDNCLRSTYTKAIRKSRMV